VKFLPFDNYSAGRRDCYTEVDEPVANVPLFDPQARSQRWNERMAPCGYWRAGFSMLGPAMLGARMIPVGLVLLGTNRILDMEAKRKQRCGASEAG
jgi:hypothetical protein